MFTTSVPCQLRLNEDSLSFIGYSVDIAFAIFPRPSFCSLGGLVTMVQVLSISADAGAGVKADPCSIAHYFCRIYFGEITL